MWSKNWRKIMGKSIFEALGGSYTMVIEITFFLMIM